MQQNSAEEEEFIKGVLEMSHSVKATTDSASRSRATVFIIVFTLLALFSIVMAVYDISTDRLVFGILFAIAAFIFIIMLLLKVNTIFGTYIKTDKDYLLMKSWIKDFLPYETSRGILSDLKPAKTKLVEIPIEDISIVLVGTKDFIKRNVSQAGKRFLKAIYPYEHSSDKARKNLISTMDLFYIETVDGESSFMCVHDFDPKKIVDVIGEIYLANPDVYIKVGSSSYRKHIKKLQSKLG